MKNFFKNFRSYNFWVSLSGAVIILLNALSKAFGFEIQNEIVQDCILSFASVLVVLGIVTKKQDDVSENDEGKFKDELDEKGKCDAKSIEDIDKNENNMDE